MGNIVRLPLAVPTVPRGNDLTKDALLSNAFIDKSSSGTMYVVKRAGTILQSNTTVATTNKGIFFTNGHLYYINDSNAVVTLI